MWRLPVCFFICSFLYLFTCLFLYLLISSLLYFLFLPFIIFYFFALSLCHSFYFFSIFLEPEPKLFHVTWVNKLHWHFIFYMVCNGKSKQHRQIRCSGAFWLFLCPGVLWGVPECSRVLRCSCVPVFLCSCCPVFQCSSVPVSQCSGVPGFSTCHSFNHFWQCVAKSCKVTIACQTN